jgi:hypothetical protein
LRRVSSVAEDEDPKRVDDRIGQCVESTLADAFRQHGIEPSAVSKRYGNLECDLVIESSKTVLLIETKKKPLTRQSQAGNTLTAFFDLVGGMLASQLQLGGHELELLRHGQITFDDGTLVELKGRGIARLAVTLLDWGGTQDRTVIRQVAGLLVGSQLSSPSLLVQDQEQLKKTNKVLVKLQNQLSELQTAGKSAREPFSNWWFLSVPQLLFTLDGVTNVEEFERRLKRVSAITFGTLDFYRELNTVLSWASKSAK